MKMKELACPNCHAPLSEGITPNQQVECANCGSVFLAQELEAAQSIACPRCRTINPIEERHCANCGELLKEKCPMCYEENPVGTVFCGNCGAHIANARARRKKMLAERKKLREERNRIFREKETHQQAEKLAQLLDDLDEPENHEFALFKINQIGPQAIDALIDTMLQDDDPDARYGSARALGQICTSHQVKTLIKARAAKALISALADEEPAVRYWAANALGRCGNSTAVEPLGNLLKERHEGVRKQAAYALREIGGDRAAELLANASKRGFFDWIKGN